MKLAVIDLDRVAAFMFEKYKRLRADPNSGMAEAEIACNQSLLRYLGIEVSNNFSDDGKMLQVLAYQTGEKLAGRYDQA